MSTVENQGFKGEVCLFGVVICKICTKIMLTKDKLGTFIVRKYDSEMFLMRQ